MLGREKANYLRGKEALNAFIEEKFVEAMEAASNAHTAATNAQAAANTKAVTRTYKGTLLSSGWSQGVPFVQEITVDGVLSTDYPFVDIDLSDVADAAAVIEAWTLVGRCTVSANNTVIAYCYEEKPVVDIPIVFKVVR